MDKMTSHERFTRIYQHKEADRVPIHDKPWRGTKARWAREGIPEGINYAEYLNLDKTASIGVDVSPRYKTSVIEKTDEYTIYTTNWGATQKEWKIDDSTPEFIDFKITDSAKWYEAKKQITPDKQRIPWDYLKKNYKTWRREGFWIQANLWFGFDVSHSWVVGTERFLMALVIEPEWCMDMFNYILDMNIALLDMVWEAGYEFDCIQWPDDMGYKNNQFFSVDMYRELLKPVHKRAIDWAHNKGIKTNMHSCGDINPFIPELIDIGLDALNPLEVKAGMDPVKLKSEFGESIVLHGGINAVLWDNIDEMEKEIRRLIPILKKSGGYIFSSDHSVPNNVSLNDFTYITELVKKLGSY